MSQSILGLHHVTAFGKDPQRSIEFFSRLLGLRLLKITVNFDEPTVYHLYFGDTRGSPGTVFTLFPWPLSVHGTPGAGQLVTTTYRVPPGALPFWRERLRDAGVETESATRFGESSLRFFDPDGLALELLESEHAPPDLTPWMTDDLDEAVALRDMARVALAVPDVERTASVLCEVLGLEPAARDGAWERLRFAGDHAPDTFIDLLAPNGLGAGRNGPGVVHHLALAVADPPALKRWRVHLEDAGFNVTDVRERHYFRSIYFREPGGVLLELATLGPGFAVDEPEERLGRTLKLPPWLEPRRAEITRRLPPLLLPPQTSPSPRAPRAPRP